jgi:hypothetical protein
MRKVPGLTLLIALVAVIPASMTPTVDDGWIAAASAQSLTPAQKQHAREAALDVFMQRHPGIARDLRTNPNLVNNSKYLDSKPELKGFLDQYPVLRKELRVNPGGLIGSKHDGDRWRPGHHDSDWRWDRRREETARGCYDKYYKGRKHKGGKHAGGLPPGLQKQYERTGHLPPGLEKQVAERGSLPPGLQKQLEPVPGDFSRCVGPLPANTQLFKLGNDLVLMNERGGQVVDVFRNFY